MTAGIILSNGGGHRPPLPYRQGLSALAEQVKEPGSDLFLDGFTKSIIVKLIPFISDVL
jgi:hypothetical protein